MNDDFENQFSDGSLYEAPNKKRRLETSSSILLPRPIEEIRPDDLKRYSREQLAAYLNSQGVIASPEDSKPSLKQRLKLVITELERQKSMGGKAPPVAELVQEKIKSGALVIESEGRICDDCKTRKSNKDCHFLRCKACCNARGFNCTVHFIYPKGRSTPSGTSNNQAAQNNSPFASPSTYPNQTRAQQTTQKSQPQTFWQQQAQLLTQGKKAGQLPFPLTNIQLPQTGLTPESVAPLLKQSYLNILQRVIRCPSCNQMISRIGSNFFLHLSRCNPEYFFAWVSSGQCIEDLMPVEQKEETPVDRAKQDASERYKLMSEFMAELFNHTSVDEIVDSTDSSFELNSAAIEERLMGMVQLANDLVSKNEVFREQFEKRSESFMNKFNQLQRCTTAEEVEQCKCEFEKEFGSLGNEQVVEGGFVERSRDTVSIPPSKREPIIISL
jgi:LRP1 type putative zinc finger protein